MRRRDVAALGSIMLLALLGAVCLALQSRIQGISGSQCCTPSHVTGVHLKRFLCNHRLHCLLAFYSALQCVLLSRESAQPLFATCCCLEAMKLLLGPAHTVCSSAQSYSGKAGVYKRSQTIAAVLMWAAPLCFACLAPLQTYADVRHAPQSFPCRSVLRHERDAGI